MTTDDLQQVVNALVEGFSDSGSKSVPMATTDADEVIRSQLTENTGRHLLDSGGHYGRNWEENQENPPWEQPAYEVYDSFVVENVYNHMSRRLDRDRRALDLEMALYAFGYSDEYASTSWLATMEAFSEMLHGPVYGPELADQYGLPEEVANVVAGYAAEFGPTDHSTFSFNTYNSEFGAISQDLQGAALGPADKPYSEYVMIQVHGGCDIRGGYTSPRVYHASAVDAMTSEFSLYCENCGWSDAESCVYDHPDLYYMTGTVDAFDFEDAALIEEGSEEPIPVLETVWDADHIDGAIIHDCNDDELGHVHP